MYTTLLILFLIIGLIIGSFLNVVVFRMDDLRSIIKGRSRCPNCGEALSWKDLVPVLSFVFLLGKCRYCKKPISWQYPVVEIGTGILFALLYSYFGLSLSLFFYLLVFSISMVILVYDIRTQMIPDEIAWAGLILALLGGWYFGGFGLVSMIGGALVGGGFLAALVYFSKEKWMGAGDIKIGATMGALVGFPSSVLGLFIAFLLGSIVGIIYIKVAKKTMKDSLPFAPFLIASSLITIMVGGYVLDWYFSAFNFVK